MVRRASVACLAVGVMALAGGSGCSSSDGDDAAVTSAPPTTVDVPTTAGATTTSSPYHWTPEQQAVVDTYEAFHWAFVKADRQPTPDFSELARYSAGELFQINMLVLRDSHDERGEVAQPGPKNLAQVVVYRQGDRDGSSFLEACIVDDAVVVRRSDNSIVNDKIETRQVNARVDRVDGQLKVTGQETVQKWAGVELSQCVGG